MNTTTNIEQTTQRLRLDSVNITYASGRGEHVPVVRNTTLEVEAGEFLAIIGPSGCGKSTLLNAIAGLMEPTSGAISVNGSQSQRLGRVAYMQQRDLLLPWRTVLNNARLGLELNGMAKQLADEAVKESATHFGLEGVLDFYPWQLSGGMRQRVALLRATLPDSEVLLLDEPFGALDAITRRDLQQWLAGVLNRTNRAVLLVTHDVEEALLLADRVYVMSHPVAGIETSITARVHVKVPRPRREETVTTPEFVALKAELMRALSNASASPVSNIVGPNQ